MNIEINLDFAYFLKCNVVQLYDDGAIDSFLLSCNVMKIMCVITTREVQGNDVVLPQSCGCCFFYLLITNECRRHSCFFIAGPFLRG